MSDDLVALFDRWVVDKRARSRRGLSPNSERAYRNDVAVLARHVGDALGRPLPDALESDPPEQRSANRQLRRLGPRDLTDANVALCVSGLVEAGYAPASRARMLSAWRGLFTWLVASGHLDRDPTLAFQAPAKSQLLPVAFTDDELGRILHAAADPPEGSRATWPKRDVAIIAVLAGAGLRASELTTLTLACVERDRAPRLKVLGKGRKERVVPIAPEVLEAIDVYLEERVTLGAHLGGTRTQDLLFVRVNGTPLNTQALDYLVDLWMGAAGVSIREGEKAHAFRHTYALGQVDSGTSLPEVQLLLGHTDLNTTSQYLRMSGANLHHAAEAAPVRALLRQVL